MGSKTQKLSFDIGWKELLKLRHKATTVST